MVGVASPSVGVATRVEPSGVREALHFLLLHCVSVCVAVAASPLVASLQSLLLSELHHPNPLTLTALSAAAEALSVLTPPPSLPSRRTPLPPAFTLSERSVPSPNRALGGVRRVKKVEEGEGEEEEMSGEGVEVQDEETPGFQSGGGGDAAAASADGAVAASTTEWLPFEAYVARVVLVRSPLRTAQVTFVSLQENAEDECMRMRMRSIPIAGSIHSFPTNLTAFVSSN